MSFLSTINTTTNNGVPVNPFAATAGKGAAGSTPFFNPFANLKKKVEEDVKKEEEAIEETAPAKEPAAPASDKATAPAEEPQKAEESAKNKVAEEKAENKAEETKEKAEEVQEAAPAGEKAAEETAEAQPEKEEKAEKAATEEKAEEAVKAAEPEKKKRRSRRKKSADTEVKAEAASKESEETDAAPVNVEPLSDDAPEFHSEYSFRQGTDILMGAMEEGEEEWLKFRDDIAARVQKVRIDSDINPGTIKFAMDELDALFTEIRIRLIQTEQAINRIDDKKTGYATIIEKDVLGKLGKVSTAERDAAVQKALIDVQTQGHHINLLFLLGKARDRKIVLDGFMSIVDAKKKALITACSVMKTEQQATGAYC